MTYLAAFTFQYGMFVLPALMFAWAIASLSKKPFTRHLLFRSFPFVFALIMFAHVAYTPIKITYPASHAIVHPGERVRLNVELTPSFLSRVFPWVALDLSRCWTCYDSPPGVVVEGALTGSPYTFTIAIPKNQPAGEFVVNAYAGQKIGDRAAIRSDSIGLLVQ